MAKLSHPNVRVQVYDFGRDGKAIRILSWNFYRDSLDGLLKKGDRCQTPKSRMCCGKKLPTDCRPHAVGIVHRDVKPHNLMLDDGGNVKSSTLALPATWHRPMS